MGRLGEIGEDDLLPEIGVARITFSTESELNKIINKTIQYQDNPVMGELKKPLMAGEQLWSDPLTFGADYMDLLIGDHDDNGYSTIGIPKNFRIDSIYDRDLGHWTKSQLLSRINR